MVRATPNEEAVSRFRDPNFHFAGVMLHLRPDLARRRRLAGRNLREKPDMFNGADKAPGGNGFGRRHNRGIAEVLDELPLATVQDAFRQQVEMPKRP
jgi:hypothetical protein